MVVGNFNVRGLSRCLALFFDLRAVADAANAANHVHNQERGGQHKKGRHNEAPQARGDLVLGDAITQAGRRQR